MDAGCSSAGGKAGASALRGAGMASRVRALRRRLGVEPGWGAQRVRQPNRGSRGQERALEHALRAFHPSARRRALDWAGEHVDAPARDSRRRYFRHFARLPGAGVSSPPPEAGCGRLGPGARRRLVGWAGWERRAGWGWRFKRGGPSADAAGTGISRLACCGQDRVVTTAAWRGVCDRSTRGL
jgi:hypothetical protein